MKAYPRDTTEAFLDGHVSSFDFFGGVLLSILYDNTTIEVAKICGDGKRERTRADAQYPLSTLRWSGLLPRARKEKVEVVAMARVGFGKR